jgi:hypothetical protein
MLLVFSSLAVAALLSDTNEAKASCGYNDVSGACYEADNNDSGAGNWAIYGADLSTTSPGAVGIIGTTTYGIGIAGLGKYQYSVGVQGENTNDVGVAGISEFANGVFGQAGSTAWSSNIAGVTAGIVGNAAASGIFGVYGQAAGDDAIHGYYSGTGGSSAVAGVCGSSSVTCSGNGVFGSTNSTSTTSYAVEGHNTGGGYGVYGLSASNDGVHGQASGASVSGVAGVNTGAGNGVYGTSNSGDAVLGYSSASNGVVGLSGTTTAPTGIAAGVVGSGANDYYGVYGVATNYDAVYGTSATGTGVVGVCQASTGTQNGVTGSDQSPNGSGVYGVNNASSVGYGVYGRSYGSSGYGVYGNGEGSLAYGVYGTASDGIGVYGLGALAGVYGNGNGTGWGGYFAGSVYTTGTYQSSDMRLKQNVRPLVDPIDELLRLHGVAFEWKSPEEHGNQTGTQRGFVAQDVEKVFPGWVTTDLEGFEAVDTHQIEALEVESIRALKDRADRADARAAKAEAENAKLKAQFADHDARLDAIERGHPRAPVSPMGFNPATGLGLFGVVFGGLVLVSNRRKKEEKAS